MNDLRASLAGQLATQVCDMCGERLQKCSSLFLDCGHLLHKLCYDYARPYGAMCPVCSPRQAAFPAAPGERLLQSMTQFNLESTQRFLENPADFGDDPYVHQMLQKRRTFMGNGSAPLTAETVAMQVRVAENEEHPQMRAAELHDRLEAVILNDTLLLEGQLGGGAGVDAVEPLYLLGIDSMGAGNAGGGAAPAGTGASRTGGSWLGGLVRRAFDADDDAEGEAASMNNTSGPVLLAKQYAGLVAGEGIVRQLIAKRVPSQLIYSRGITAIQCVEDGVTLPFLLLHGYGIQDMVVLRFGWQHMLKTGLTPKVWCKYKETLLPVDQMALFLQVGLMDVLHVMCGDNVEMLAQCGFSPSEMQLLLETSKQRDSRATGGASQSTGLTVAYLLVHLHHMQRHQMLRFQGWRLPDWQGVGLSVEHMRALDIDPEFAQRELRWTPQEFQRVYNKSMQEALGAAPVQRPPPPPMPAPAPVRAPQEPPLMTPRAPPPSPAGSPLTGAPVRGVRAPVRIPRPVAAPYT